MSCALTVIIHPKTNSIAPWNNLYDIPFPLCIVFKCKLPVTVYMFHNLDCVLVVDVYIVA